MKHLLFIFLAIIALSCNDDDGREPDPIPAIPVDMIFAYHCDIDRIETSAYDPREFSAPPDWIEHDFIYDPDGRLIRITRAFGDFDQLDQVDLHFIYGQMNRITAIGLSQSIDNPTIDTLYELTYDGLSDKISRLIIPPIYEYMGSYYEVVYDDENRISEMIQIISRNPYPESPNLSIDYYDVYTYSYDANDNLAEVRYLHEYFDDKSRELQEVTEYTYDYTKRPLRFYPDGSFPDVGLDVLFKGNIPSRNFRFLTLDPKVEVTYRFDPLGRPIYMELVYPQSPDSPPKVETTQIYYKN